MEPIIKIEHLDKWFKVKDMDVHALDDISLDIYKGEIYGIIGMSGAGKSTLVRCLNFLERPTSGDVIVDGKNLAKLSNKELRATRKDIGMIFQHFNLLMQLSNGTGWSKKERGKRKSTGISEDCWTGRKGQSLSGAALRWAEAACGDCQSAGQRSEDLTV